LSSCPLVLLSSCPLVLLSPCPLVLLSSCPLVLSDSQILNVLSHSHLPLSHIVVLSQHILSDWKVLHRDDIVNVEIVGTNVRRKSALSNIPTSESL
jgi:hypothetical protein